MSNADVSAPIAKPLTVFLSYARDDQARVVNIVSALEAVGHTVQWDALLAGGALFAKAIEDALRASDVVVVAWSKQSVTSDWVLDEAQTGRDLKKLVPVTLDGTQPPLGFGQYHAVDLRQWHGDVDAAQFSGVLRGIAAVMARESSSGAITALSAARSSAASSTAAIDTSHAGALRWSRRRALSVAAVTAGAAGVAVWRSGLLQLGASIGANTIAVLPFANLSGDPQQAYFSDGVAEEVRATLARQPRYRVMGETSSGKFREHKEGAVAVAKQLGVAFLLEGSVRRAGDVVRIAADLVDGATGFSRWAQSFERRVTDIFAIQTEIATAVAAALARVAPSDSEDVGQTPKVENVGGTSNVVAYDAYLRGRALYELGQDEASDRAALAQFDAAIGADANYATAHAARARSLNLIANLYVAIGQRAALYDAAIAAAQRAIVLAPTLADAYSTLGVVLFQGRLDARAALAPFTRAVQLGAGDAAVLGRYALYAARIGNDREARRAANESSALDPLNPLGDLSAATVEYAARRYAAAIPFVQRALHANPKLSRANGVMGDALLQLGQLVPARKAYLAEALADVQLTGLAIVEWQLGNRSAARSAMTKLSANYGDIVLYQQAQILAQWHEPKAALAKLERARAVGDSGLIYARNDPLIDPLRNDVRLIRLLASIGFA